MLKPLFKHAERYRELRRDLLTIHTVINASALQAKRPIA